MKNQEYRLPLYQRQDLRFGCTQCGDCCAGSSDYHVYLNATKAEEIRQFLQLSTGWFKRRYLAYDENSLVLQSHDDGRCILLGKDGRCRVYPVRPVQCSTYPFWPEIIKTTKSWYNESLRCEGIGQGDVVSLEQIELALRQCIEAEDGS